MTSMHFGPGPYPGPRRVVLARNGMAATSHPLAAEAGLHMLRQGGTAADAAVAMAAMLTVVEPTSNGLGSDAFALVWAEDRLHGLNGSGRSPLAASLGALLDAGHRTIPERGWDAVTVPGAPAAWHDLHARFGRLPFADVLAPAIDTAHEGHPVAPVVAHYWERAARGFLELDDPQFAGWRETFAPRGQAPRAGELFHAPFHADTLHRLAQSDVKDFYEGTLARRIEAFSLATGGRLTGDDLAAHTGDWVQPLSVPYRDVELWEIPPNGQGLVALAALGMLGGPAPEDVEVDLHRAIEAVKLAFADARTLLTDVDQMTVDPDDLIGPEYLCRRTGLIGDRAEMREAGRPERGGTVYLAAADGDGMMVSFIQSNYMGFGSGVVIPGTGIALQNRAAGFSMDPEHVNVFSPGKRPFHTIIPGFLTRDGKPWGPVGVMGGHMQPQGHVQVVRALVDRGLDPQAALDQPRWIWEDGLKVVFETLREGETCWPGGILDRLRARGHEITETADQGRFGRGQIILRLDNGVYAAGSDSRADGLALGF